MLQRWVTTVVGASVVALAVGVVVRGFRPPKALGREPDPAASGAAAGDRAIAPGDPGSGQVALTVDAGELAAPVDVETRGDAGWPALLPDGAQVPPLPLTAPRQVRFGVVLVSYAGAQPAPGVHPATRSKAEARALAERLLATARQDFHAAVQQGDAGSTDDLGRVKTGILEAAPEYVLFTLPVDGVGGPVDTPRGYWIVKRLE